MLKISGDRTDDQPGNDPVLLWLEGQVSGPWVEELRRVCSETMSGEQGLRTLTLDLAGVSFIDANGVALFQELSARHVILTNGSLFVMEQLKGVTHASH